MPFDFDLDDLLSGMFGTRRSSYETKQPMVEQGIEVTLEEAFNGAVRHIKLMTGHGRERRLEVKIPPGVDSDSRIHISDHGMELYLIVRMLPHQRLRRDGDDIKTEVDVDLLDAVLGGEVELLTLSGKVVLRIPPETQNGRVFRLVGRGMPVLGNKKTNGNLYATVRVRMPQALNDAERQLFEKLRDARLVQDVKHE
jgi:DnaJ-class molecular chaperone